jgi:hypothetical protein
MDARLELLLWTGITLLLGTVAVNAAYRAQGGRLIEWTETSPTGIVTREVALFLFMVGIPFITLISGAASLDLLALGTDLADPNALAGFTVANWVRGIGITAVVVITILLILWVGGRSSPHGAVWRVGPLALRDALYREVHWTFYRAAPALLLNDLYWGCVIGALLVMLEWATHPDTPTWLRSVEGRQYMTVQIATLLSSCFLYLATQNLWLMILANLLIQVLGSRVLSAQRQEQRLEIRD